MKFKALLVLMSLCIQTACSSYEEASINHEKLFQELGAREITQEHINVAQERLKNSRVLNGQNISFEPDNGLSIDESFLVGLSFSPELAIYREEIKNQQSWLYAVSGIGAVTFNAQNTSKFSDGRHQSSLMFDIKQILGSDLKKASMAIGDAKILSAQLSMFEAQWQLYSFLRRNFAALSLLRAEKKSLIALQKKYVDNIGKSATAFKKSKRSTQSAWSMYVMFASEIDTRISDIRVKEINLTKNIKERIGLMPETKHFFEASPISYTAEQLENKTTLKSAALQKRWDLQLLLAQYEIKEQELRKAVASQYPSMYLGPTFRFGPGSDIFGGSLTLNFPDSRHSKGQIESAAAKRLKTRHRIEKRLLHLAHSIERTLALFNNHLHNRKNWQNDVLPAVSKASDASIVALRKNPEALKDSVEMFEGEFHSLKEYWALQQTLLASAMDLEQTLGYPLFKKISP